MNIELLPNKMKILRINWLYPIRFQMICFLLVLVLANETFAKESVKEFESDKITLVKALQYLSRDYQVFFSYDQEVVRDIEVNFEPERYENVEHALDRMLKGTSLHYKVFNNRYIILYESSPEALSSLKGMVEHLETVIDKEEHSISLRKITFPVTVLPPRISAFAVQPIAFSVSGKVTDEKDVPLIGVNIQVKGTGKGTSTDFNGEFSFDDIDENAVLVISYVGFQTQEVVVAGKSSLDIVLTSDSQLLDEVVVVGYGSLKRKELTSAVTSVSPDEMNIDVGTGTDIRRVLQGKVAGLSVTRPNAGNPNQDFEVRLRGTTSISGDQSPLIVVDGVPGGDISTIDPNDIKSIDVLKDASAAAIYGTRGTNGVIVIETKSGETVEEGVNIIFSSQLFTEKVAKQTKMLTRNQYLEVKNQIKESMPDVSESMIDYGYDTDWFSEIQRNNTINHKQKLVIEGKDKNTNYRLSGSYFKHEGIMIETGRNDYKANFSLMQNALNKRLLLRAQLGLRESNAKPMSSIPYMMAMAYNPTQPVYFDNDPEKGYYQQFGQHQYKNPVAELELPSQANKSGNYFTKLNSQLNLFKGLSLNLLFSYNVRRGFNGRYVPSSAYDEIESNRHGTASRSSSQNISKTFESTLNWNKRISKSKFDFVGGYSYHNVDNESMSATNYDFISDDFNYHNLGAGSYLGNGRASINSNKSASSLVGFFIRGVYNWDDRFYYSISARKEGSSKFGPENRWGVFPAVSAAWNITNERFFENIEWVDFMKIRIGYGKTGNQGIPNYLPFVRLSTSGYFFYNGEFIQGYAPVSNANPNIKWETKHEFDYGIDWVILNGRLGGNIDLYSRRTVDLIHDYDVPVPPNLYPSTFANVATMSNQGIELTVNAVPIKKENFQWDIDITFDHRNQRIESLSRGQYKLEYRDVGDNFFPGSSMTHTYTHRYAEGGKVGNFYGYKFKGFDEDGKWIFEDLNNDGVIDLKDNAIIGNGLPDYHANFNTYLRLKNWSFSAMFRGQFGHDILNAKRLLYGSMKRLPKTMLADFDKKLYDTQEYSDYYLEKGDWVKLDNLTLGYNLNSPIIDFAKELRLYFVCTNLLTYTKSQVQEPEVSIAGLTPGVSQVLDYPGVRSFSIGIDVNF